MNPKNKKNMKKTASPKFFITIMLIATFIICTLIVAFSVTPPKYDVKEGDIATSTIQAPRDVIDTITTESMKNKAVADVAPVFKEDPAITEKVKKEVDDYFAVMEQIRAYCEKRKNSEADPDASWSTILNTYDMSYLDELAGDYFSQSDIYRIAAMSEDAVSSMAEDLKRKIDSELKYGVKEENLEDQRGRLYTQVVTSYSDDVQRFIRRVLNMLEPNLLYDEAATEAEKEAARESVVPASYKTGQNIIQEGEVVTAGQIGVLNDLGLLQNDTTDYALYGGVCIYIFVMFVLFYMYTQVFERRIVGDVKSMAILFIIITATVALTFFLSLISKQISAVFMGAILVGALVKPRTGIMATLLLAFICAPIGASSEGVLSASALYIIACTLAGGMTAVYFIRRTQHRIAFIIAGIAAGFAGAFMNVAVALVNGLGTQPTLLNCGLTLLSGLIAGILTIGVLPIFESAFKLATPTKLLELLNPNQKLLRRLSLEAPATYHHSTITANLAEAAAEEIGANALLARTAAYYHDIGKLKNPNMFTENQRGVNPHDTLSPEMSCDIIKGHASYGVTLAHKYNLPREITDAIAQHHGTTTMAVFYAKAKAKNAEVTERRYQYDGPKPQSVESAIIMLADCTEAAVRSMDLSDREKISELIGKLSSERVQAGQFDECGLTFRDLEKIREAFLSVYDGVFHERVKYPDQERRDAKD